MEYWWIHQSSRATNQIHWSTSPNGETQRKDVIPHYGSWNRRHYTRLPMAFHIWTKFLMERWSHWHNPITRHYQIAQLAHTHSTHYYLINSDRKDSNRRSKTKDCWYPHRRKSNWIYCNRFSNQSRTVHQKGQSTREIPTTPSHVQWRSSATLPSQKTMGSRHWSETEYPKYHWLQSVPFDTQEEDKALVAFLEEQGILYHQYPLTCHHSSLWKRKMANSDQSRITESWTNIPSKIVIPFHLSLTLSVRCKTHTSSPNSMYDGDIITSGLRQVMKRKWHLKPDMVFSNHGSCSLVWQIHPAPFRPWWIRYSKISNSGSSWRVLISSSTWTTS